MPEPEGYARILARARADQDQIQPIFAKPYVKYPMALSMATYFLQLGVVLGAKHRHHTDPFARCFLGLQDNIDSVFEEGIQQIGSTLKEGMAFSDFVQAHQIKSMTYLGEPSNLLSDLKNQKVLLPTAEVMSNHYAQQGAILGVMSPGQARKLYDSTHGDHPPRLAFDVVTEGENQIFLAYAHQSFPNLFPFLSGL